MLSLNPHFLLLHHHHHPPRSSSCKLSTIQHSYKAINNNILISHSRSCAPLPLHNNHQSVALLSDSYYNNLPSRSLPIVWSSTSTLPIFLSATSRRRRSDSVNQQTPRLKSITAHSPYSSPSLPLTTHCKASSQHRFQSYTRSVSLSIRLHCLQISVHVRPLRLCSSFASHFRSHLNLSRPALHY